MNYRLLTAAFMFAFTFMVQKLWAMESESWGADIQGTTIRLSPLGTKGGLLLDCPDTTDLSGTISAPLLVVETNDVETDLSKLLTLKVDTLIINNKPVSCSTPFSPNIANSKYLKLRVNNQDVQAPLIR